MKIFDFDIAVIGGGAAGLSAAAVCSAAGRKVAVIERSSKTGGVLQQCIHSGFGLHYFKEELTGPEYAARLNSKAADCGVSIMTDCTVTAVNTDENGHKLQICSGVRGVFQIYAKAVILAMGCRERCRGNLGIPGERCAGIFNAGFAQQLINTEGYLPGKKAVIVGSGDIGLIMARRLTWSGVKVQCVVEIMPHPAGLSRNIAQCLEDFDIPLYLSHTVTAIEGRKRVEKIRIAPLVNGKTDLENERSIECDTVLFSVGLVPENELSRECGVKLHPVSGGAVVDGNMMTSVEGIFACGNVLHVHDLVDYVSEEAERAARGAAAYCEGNMPDGRGASAIAGDGLRYIVPSSFAPSRGCRFYMRPSFAAERARLVVKNEKDELVLSENMCYIKAAEMISFEIGNVAASSITVSLERV